MFTGLIEKCGEVIANQKGDVANQLIIKAPFDHLQLGESIAVNGVCLTLISAENDQLAFDVSPETLKLTTLGELCVGDYVNIERAMLATTRFGGHYVSGHVDTTASVVSIGALGDFIEMKVGGFANDKRYLLPKGSITLDGVSLTINAVEKASITLMLVPHTLAVTTLGQMQIGQSINVEFDYLTRVVAHQIEMMREAAFS